MADYTDLLRRAIDALPENNGTSRRAVFQKAREALVSQLRAITPPLPAREITQHRLILEDCIRVAEQEATESLLVGLKRNSHEKSNNNTIENNSNKSDDLIAELARIVAEDELQFKEMLGSRTEEPNTAPQAITEGNVEDTTTSPLEVIARAIATLDVDKEPIVAFRPSGDNASEPSALPVQGITDVDRKKIKIIESGATVASKVVGGKIALVDAPADAPPKVQNQDDRNARAVALAEISLEMASDVEGLKYNIPPRIVGLLERCAEKLTRHELNWYSLDQSIQAIEGFKIRNYEEDWNDEFRDSVQYLLNGIRDLEPLVRPYVPDENDVDKPKPEAINVNITAGDGNEIKIISGSISELAKSDDARDVFSENTLKDLQDTSLQLKETADAIEHGNANMLGASGSKKAILVSAKTIYVLATGIASSLIATTIVSPVAGQRVLETLWRIIQQLLKYIT